MSFTEILYWVLMVILILLAWNHVSIDWSDIPLHLLNRNIPFCNFGWFPFPLCPSSTTYTHIYTYLRIAWTECLSPLRECGWQPFFVLVQLLWKEILRLYKDSKQTNLYKVKKIQKNLKKTNKQTKQRPFRFIQIYSLSRNTDIITFFVPQNQNEYYYKFLQSTCYIS